MKKVKKAYELRQVIKVLSFHSAGKRQAMLSRAAAISSRMMAAL